jgi:prolycopene isomerase
MHDQHLSIPLKSKELRMDEQKIAIIGGGMAGLTAAAYLACAGFTVKVFEQHTTPGGYVSSFMRKGFIFPAGPTSFGSNGIIFPIFKELNLAEHLQFIRSGHQISWGSNDIPLMDPAQTKHDLEGCFPEKKAVLRKYFRWVEIGSRAFHDLLKGGIMFGRDVPKEILRLMLHHPLSFWAFWIADRNTNRSLHARFFKNGSLRHLLDQLGFPVMTGRNTLGMWASYYNDTWIPKGGMQVPADLLVRYIREHGGEVHLGKRIRQIRIENGQAQGVETENGEFMAADFVVSAVDLNQACYQLIERSHLPSVMVCKLEKACPSESIFAVFLGLDGSPELAGILKRFCESHVHFTCADGKSIQLVLLSKDDPSVAPEGKHAMFIASLSSFEIWEGLRFDRKAYLEQKDANTEALLTRAEEFLPGLRAHIVVQDAATPLTYERYTSNWHGSTSGWNWNPKSAPHFDFNQDLPIRQLYLAGHYAHNPGGVPTAMITAWYIAKAIIAQ